MVGYRAEIDEACISRNRDLVVHPGSRQTRMMTFQDGLPFERVIDVLRSIPNGFSAATVCFKSSVCVLYTEWFIVGGLLVLCFDSCPSFERRRRR